MNKKQIALFVVLLVLAGTAVYMFKDWFAEEPIQISCLIRPARPSRRAPPPRQDAPSGRPGYNVTFALNHKVAITAIQVFPLQDVLTNKYPHAIWNLQSVSNTVPTKSIIYGERIRGMQPTVKGATADPLEPGGAYRLIIEAGNLKAEKDFQMPP